METFSIVCFWLHKFWLYPLQQTLATKLLKLYHDSTSYYETLAASAILLQNVIAATHKSLQGLFIPRFF